MNKHIRINHFLINNRIYSLLGLFILVMFFAGCSTKKNTPITRTYHNITSRWNILFNGKESFKNGVRKVNENFKDDYSRVLPVFKFGDPEVNQVASSDMERTLKKASKLISMHSITVKPELKSNKPLTAEEKEFYDQKEFNKWVDDNYLLIGKAHFYNGDYNLAKENFRFMFREFPNKETLYDAKIWLARTYQENNEFRDANAILSELEYDTDVPKRLKKDLYTTLADYHLKLDNYEKGANYLEKALDHTKDKENKIRYTFILAQVNDRLENYNTASRLFRNVIKMNPPYEMAFQAKINRALAFRSTAGGAGNIKNELRKMLKDDKNIEFQDQIYYALGEIEHKQGNMDKAMEYYQQSIRASVDNIDQKARSFLTVADIQYDRQQYLDAQAYYDSAVSVIDNSYPNYEDIFTRSTSLTKLADHVNTFQLQDSVLKLSVLPENELMAVIDGIIEDVKEEERLTQILEQERLEDERLARQMAMENRMSLNDQGSSWYFYNQNTKSSGESEFIAKWGNRKLEDHWRRKNKSSSSYEPLADSEEDEGTIEEVKSAKDTLSNKSRQYYLVDIPFTDSAKTASHEKIKNALFNMGLIYRTDLEDYDQAIESFEELIERYPQTEYELPSYYNLHDLYKELNKPMLSQAYKNKILAEYPDSKFALIISDPDYAKRLEEEENKVNRYYEQIYKQYRNGRYHEVLTATTKAMAEFDGHELEPQFAYLRAMAVGFTQPKSNLKTELQEFINNYPSSELVNSAKSTLKFMTEGSQEILLEEEKKKIAKVDYLQPIDNEQHLVILVTDKKADVNQLVFNIITFNLDNYDQQNLLTEQEELTESENVVLVKQFKSKQEAGNYFTALLKYEELFKDVDERLVKPVVISIKNYKLMKDNKAPESYYPFYEQYYQ